MPLTDDPASYPHTDPPGPPARPVLPWIEDVRRGDDLMMVEPEHNQRFLAPVVHTEPLAVVCSVLIDDSGNRYPRAFARNGWEIGAVPQNGPPAYLLQLTPDWEPKLRKREAFLILAALVKQYGEDAFPLNTIQRTIAEARSYQRQRATKIHQEQTTLANARNSPAAETLALDFAAECVMTTDAAAAIRDFIRYGPNYLP